MENEQTDNLKENRAKTDDSLQSERKKTDSYLVKENKTVELESNKLVDKNREEADKLLKDSREKIDRETKEKTGKKVEHFLGEERLSSDRASEVARKNEDEILQQERSQKKQISEELLDVERSDTDYNLKFERVGADETTESISVLVTSANEALNTRDTYLGILSHDLKTPLSAISINAGAIKRAYNNHVLEKLDKRFIDSIERNVATMGRMIDDLLDVEQMVNGVLKLSLKKYDLSKLIEECKELFEPIAESQQVSIQVKPMEAGMITLLDHDRISQVLSNLVGNALKFSKPGDVITIEAKKDKDNYSVSVQDMGPGIPQDKLSEIFERFAQLKDHDKRGAGLGLFISKWIVKAHEGKIYATSTLGKGSTFHFTIPLTQKLH